MIKIFIVVFNKIDLIEKDIILSYIKKLNETNLIDDFFHISAKYNRGLDLIKKYLVTVVFVANRPITGWHYFEHLPYSRWKQLPIFLVMYLQFSISNGSHR